MNRDEIVEQGRKIDELGPMCEAAGCVPVPIGQLADIFRRLKVLTLLGQSWLDENISKEVLSLRLQVFSQADFGALYAGQWLPREINQRVREEAKKEYAAIIANPPFLTASPAPRVDEGMVEDIFKTLLTAKIYSRENFGSFRDINTTLGEHLRGYNYSEVRAALEAALSVAPADGWRRISEAPTDGEPLLVCFPEPPPFEGWVMFTARAMGIETTNPCYAPPTHFLPRHLLPLPPKEGK